MLRGKFFANLLLTNTKACMANRSSFLFQMLFMIINNLVFVVTWWIFFQNYREIRGWQLSDLLALNGIVASAYGLTEVVTGGVRDLARSIADGEIDSFLVQPKNPLLHILISMSAASGWGDLVSGVIFFWLSGYLTIALVPLLAGLVFASFLVMAASCVLLHAGAFWAGQINGLARLGRECLILFSVYPQSIYDGGLKVLLFTIIPAGFIGYLPVEILRSFSWEKFFFLVIGASVYSILAMGVFRLGLSRYQSGSRMGIL